MKSLRYHRVLYLVPLVVVVLALAACVPATTQPAAPQPTSPPEESEAAAPAEEAPAPADQATFIMCVNNQPNNIDPHVGSSNPEQEIQTAAYETLVTYEPGTFDLKPLLATAWEYNDDYTQLTLTIREGVQFHDGSTLDAEAVKAGLERSMTIGQGESFFLDPTDRKHRNTRFQYGGDQPESAHTGVCPGTDPHLYSQ